MLNWILPYWKLWFPVLIFKYLNLRNYSAHFVQNCQFYFNEVLVNDTKGIITFEKFRRSYDDLYI